MARVPWTHPSPLCCRSEDLEYIYDQLRAVKGRGMARLLDKLQSSYFPAFQAMFRDVQAGEYPPEFSHITSEASFLFRAELSSSESC